MNCDQAFAILTRGPFPQGASTDVAVERHLSRCPSCWLIAEALRPAADVFDEALPAADRRQLPVYHAHQVSPMQAMSAVTDRRGSSMARSIIGSYGDRLTDRPTFPLGAVSLETHATLDWLKTARLLSLLAIASVAAISLGWWWQ